MSGAAVELLSLSAGSTISIHQDDEDTNNFYLSAGDPKGFVLRARDKSGKDKALCFNASVLSRAIMKSFDYAEDEKSIRFKIIEEPVVEKKVKYYLLGHLAKSKD